MVNLEYKNNVKFILDNVGRTLIIILILGAWSFYNYTETLNNEKNLIKIENNNKLQSKYNSIEIKLKFRGQFT